MNSFCLKDKTTTTLRYYSISYLNFDKSNFLRFDTDELLLLDETSNTGQCGCVREKYIFPATMHGVSFTSSAIPMVSRDRISVAGKYLACKSNSFAVTVEKENERGNVDKVKRVRIYAIKYFHSELRHVKSNVAVF